MMEGMEGKQGMMCKCSHHKMESGFVVLFGVVFLGVAFGWWDMVTAGYIWPIIVIVAGGMKFFSGKCKCC